MTIYELLTFYKPYELLLDINTSVRFDSVVTRNERPSVTGIVSTMLVVTFIQSTCFVGNLDTISDAEDNDTMLGS